MRLIAVTEIYGKTPEFEKLVAEISAPHEAGEIVDPYGGRFIEFAGEEEAYGYFQENCGLEGLVENLQRVMDKSDEPVILVGFSVGASAVWKVAGRSSAGKIARAVCYYGSQIRSMTELTPLCETRVVFPAYEAHFDVERLLEKLAGKERVHCIKTGYLHGFMNKRSGNFDQAGYDEHLIGLRKIAALPPSPWQVPGPTHKDCR